MNFLWKKTTLTKFLVWVVIPVAVVWSATLLAFFTFTNTGKQLGLQFLGQSTSKITSNKDSRPNPQSYDLQFSDKYYGYGASLDFVNADLIPLNQERDCKFDGEKIVCAQWVALTVEQNIIDVLKQTPVANLQAFNFQPYVLALQSDDDTIIIQQENPDFTFLTPVEYTTQDNQIIIDRQKTSFPIVLYFKKEINIDQSDWIDANSIVVIWDTMRWPRFYAMNIDGKIWNQTLDYDIDIPARNAYTNYNDGLYNLDIQKLAKQSEIFPQGYINEEAPLDFSLTLQWYKRSANYNIKNAILLDQSNWIVSVISDDWISSQPQWQKLETSKNGDNLQINIKKLEPHKNYSIELKIEEDSKIYNYSINFLTVDQFVVRKQKALQYTDYADNQWQQNDAIDNNQYTGNQFQLCYGQSVDAKEFKKVLDNAIWSGLYILNRMADYENEDGYNYTYNTPDKCAVITHYFDPEKEHSVMLKDVKSKRWETSTDTIVIPPYRVKNQDSYAKLVWTPTTTLPTYEKQRVQVIVKNIKEATLYYRACNLGSDGQAVFENTKNTTDWNSDWYYNTALHSFVSCDETKTMPIEIKDFVRWKENVIELSYDKLFWSDIPKVVEIGFAPFSTKRGNIVITTDIGVFSKYARNTLYLWANSLITGKPLASFDYTIVYRTVNSSVMETVNGTAKWSFNYKFPQDIQFGYILIRKGADATFMAIPKTSLYNWSKYYNNEFSLNLREIGWGSEPWYQQSLYKVYGFTDRVLYKAADRVFISWWVRKPWVSSSPKWTVNINVYSPNGEILYKTTLKKVDDFGWFVDEFDLWDSPELGTYRINYQFDETNSKLDPISFSSFFQVQEFKKSNFALETEMIQKDSDNYVRIAPSYYFGWNLASYDVKLSYSLQQQYGAVYDWNWCGENYCENPIYYNNTENNAQAQSGWFFSIEDYEAEYIDLWLNISSSYLANFVMNATVVDKTTKEVVNKFIEHKIYPDKLVGIMAWPYEWHDATKWSFELKWKVVSKNSNDKEMLDNYENASKTNLTLSVFYKDFQVEEEEWVDGERYYSYEWKHKKIEDIQITTQNDGNFTKKVDVWHPWSYVFVIKDESWNTNVLNLFVYDSEQSGYYYGNIGNNYALKILAKDKEYEPGDEITVDIDPYIKWANVIVTVEKNGEILEKQEKVLDGKPITLKANKDRYPNAHIGVVQIVGKDVNDEINKNRQEARFYIWYKNVNFSPSAQVINFDLQLTNKDGGKQEYYQPWQEMKMQINTTDWKGEPLQTRLTLGVVDKALLDIFDELKKPLENIYMYTDPGFFVITNYHLLFKALKVFTSQWQKWWGWSQWNDWSLLAVRKIFRDTAYWNGWIVTDKNGKAEVSFTLPDNLTTRVVETIAVSKEGQMSSDRHFFQVNKDVIVNANLPRFITPYTTVRVPLSMIINKKDAQELPLVAQITLGDTKKDRVIQKENEEYFIDLTIDDFSLEEIVNNDYITLYFAAWNQDAIEQQIPIRKENIYQQYFSTSYTKKDSSILQFAKENASLAYIQASVATLPVVEFSNSIKYLLRYPYGCTEQLLSSLYPTLIAKDFSEKWLLEEGIIDWDMIDYMWKQEKIKDVVANTLQKIYKNKSNDGLLSYWWWNADQWNMDLTIYAYYVLSYAKTLGYKVDEKFISDLEKSIKSFKSESAHMYFLMQKAFLGQNVSQQEVTSLIAKSKPQEKYPITVMAYVINAYQWSNKTDMQEYIEKTMAAYTDSQYTPYYDAKILKALYVRGLLKNNEKAKATILVHEIIDTMQYDRYYLWSTQSTMQETLALADFMYDYKKDTSSQKYTLTIDGIEYSWDLSGEVVQTYMTTVKNMKNIDTSFASQKEFFVSYAIKYIPSKPSAELSQLHNIQWLWYAQTTPDTFMQESAWTITKHKANFGVTKQANQFAVSYYIPANSYILNTIKNNSDSYCEYDCYNDYANTMFDDPNAITFTSTSNTSERYSCQPTHFEVRYDRLFLYYDYLPANAGCEINFSTMNTHNASIQSISATAFEMYRTNVWWSTYIE